MVIMTHNTIVWQKFIIYHFIHKKNVCFVLHLIVITNTKRHYAKTNSLKEPNLSFAKNIWNNSEDRRAGSDSYWFGLSFLKTFDWDALSSVARGGGREGYSPPPLACHQNVE